MDACACRRFLALTYLELGLGLVANAALFGSFNGVAGYQLRGGRPEIGIRAAPAGGRWWC